MATIAEARFVFIAGIEGSGTTMMLELLDRLEGFASLGGQYISRGFEETGHQLNQLTARLWKLPTLPPADKSTILREINAIEVGAIHTVVYKRSTPFQDAQYMPDLADLAALGSSRKLIIVRRHFFDNVNSILRRGFESDVDVALDRIAAAYQHLYKQVRQLPELGLQCLTLDYEKLIDPDSKQRQLALLAPFLDCPLDEVVAAGGLIAQPTAGAPRP
jgi:hypothetical protein